MHACAIISDVHANLEALQAVLRKIADEHIDRILFLGDSVGYGPDPDACTDILHRESEVMIAGNHDFAATGLADARYFNPHAKAAIEWTSRVLSEPNIQLIQGLPLTKRLREDDVFLVHATPKEPGEWHYLLTDQHAGEQFSYFEESICFLGHSHVPFIIELSAQGNLSLHRSRAEIMEGSRYIVNVGSVGQPRDGNPDAAYAVIKDNIVKIKRASYDILLTQKKMKKAGLPSYLIERLSRGR